MLIGAMLASLVTFLVGAQVASAHHSEIGASVNCAGLVTWTATAWDGNAAVGERTNDDVRVWYEFGFPVVQTEVSPTNPNDLSPINPAHGRFQASNNYSFGGSFQFPAAAPDFILVFVQEQASWASGAGPAGYKVVQVDRLPDCTPGTPSATAAAACVNGAGTVNATLAVTSGTGSVTFTVTIPGQAPATYTVAAGASQNLTFLAVPNGTVTITAPGMTTVSATVDCTPGTPSATASTGCVNTEGTVSATLAVSPGVGSVTFTVTIPGQAPATYTVAAGASQSLSFSGVPNGTVTISAPGMTTVTATVNCTPGTPSATAAAECVDGAGTVTATLAVSAGVGSVTFTVTIPGQPAATYTVAAGGSQNLAFSGVANGTVTISAPGMTTVSATVDCRPGTPSATASASCVNAAGTVNVSLAVTPGSGSVVFTVTIPGQPAASYTVASGGSQNLTFTGVANGTVTISAPGMTTVSATVNCVPGTSSATTATAVCTSATTATVAVTFSVTGGTIPSAFSIQSPSGVADFSLSGGGTRTVTFTASPGPFTVNYSVDGVAKSVSTATPIVCSTPGTADATISQRCVEATGQVTITLIHTGGTLPVPVVVNGTSITLTAGETRNIVVGPVADGLYTTTVTIDGVAKTLQIAIACSDTLSEPPVVPPPAATPPPPTTLPVTGTSNLGSMLTIGFGLLSLGGLALFGRRRRPTLS